MQQRVVGKGNEAREHSFGTVCNFLKDESRSHQNTTGYTVCSLPRGSFSVSQDQTQVVCNSFIQMDLLLHHLQSLRGRVFFFPIINKQMHLFFNYSQIYSHFCCTVSLSHFTVYLVVIMAHIYTILLFLSSNFCRTPASVHHSCSFSMCGDPNL